MLDVIGIFSVSDEGTHIGLLEYASQANIKIYFDDQDPVDRVKKLTQAKGGTTNIASGLEESLFMFDVDNGGMRQEVKPFLFFFPTKKFACMLVTWKPGTNACIPHWTSPLLNDKFPSFCRWRSFSFSSRMEPTQTPMQI